MQVWRRRRLLLTLMALVLVLAPTPLTLQAPSLALAQDVPTGLVVAGADGADVALYREPADDAVVVAVLASGTLVHPERTEIEVAGVRWRFVADERGNAGYVRVSQLAAAGKPPAVSAPQPPSAGPLTPPPTRVNSPNDRAAISSNPTIPSPSAPSPTNISPTERAAQLGSAPAGSPAAGTSSSSVGGASRQATQSRQPTGFPPAAGSSAAANQATPATATPAPTTPAPASIATVLPAPAARTATVRRGGRSVQVRTVERERAPDGREMVAGRLLVRFKRDANQGVRDGAHRAAGAVAAESIGLPETVVVQVPAGAAARALAAYRGRADVLSAEPDYVRRATAMTNDPRLPEQYGLTRVGAPTAWDRSKSDPRVRIAILDCGVYGSSSVYMGPDGRGHADVRDKVVLERDFSESPNGADDWCDHGTLMAGVAAASTNNGLGIAGVGYHASILNGKVLGDDGSGSTASVVSGIVWAADNGAKVISMSLGGSGACSASEQAAVEYAWSKGAVVVAAAGNGGDDGVGDAEAEAPANCDKVLGVAATDRNDARAVFSNYGTNVDLAAPGVDILSTDFLGSYDTVSGTSPATPHVAGVAALLWTTDYGTSPQAVVDRITSTAKRIAGTGSDWTYGLVDAAVAVGGAPAPVSCTPRPPVSVATTIATTPSGSALQVVISATGAGNLIRGVRLGGDNRAPANALVDVAGGPSGIDGPSQYVPREPKANVTLSIRRATPGQPTTVPIVVTDACGTWDTFVGGGPDAGF